MLVCVCRCVGRCVCAKEAASARQVEAAGECVCRCQCVRWCVFVSVYA